MMATGDVQPSRPLAEPWTGDRGCAGRNTPGGLIAADDEVSKSL